MQGPSSNLQKPQLHHFHHLEAARREGSTARITKSLDANGTTKSRRWLWRHVTAAESSPASEVSSGDDGRRFSSLHPLSASNALTTAPSQNATAPAQDTPTSPDVRL